MTSSIKHTLFLLLTVALSAVLKTQAAAKPLFAETSVIQPKPTKYGDNVIRVFPLRVLDLGGIGVGIDYEHIFGKNKNVGIVVPITYVISALEGNNANSEPSSIYFSPGLKIYPFGQRRVSYAVGPNLFIGYGSGKYKTTIYTGLGNPVVNEEKLTRIRMGLFVNNYLNIQLSNSFNFGIEVGVGVRYIDRFQFETSPSYNDGIYPTGNFAMSFGYRF